MSDNYIVSARKYRPATFRSVVGQKNLTSTLKNSIEQDRLASAYLFCGPRGVGKTSCARIFAKTINCLNRTADGEACGECASCRAIEQGNSFNIVELDAASNNSVDDIRSITEQVNIPPQTGAYRVFIIDEVHMLSSQAFNAFLKTLEEPPHYAVFILATTEKHKVIPTILSRCQIYDFKRITIDDMVEHLQYVAGQEGITADPRALGVIARKADGAMRDALSIFDQVAASTRGNLTYDAVVANLNVLDYDYFFRLVDVFAQGDVPDALLLYKDIRDRGFDSLFFVNSLAQHIRDLMVAADARTTPLLEVPADVAARLTEQARKFPVKWYYAAMKILNDCDTNYRTAGNKQFLVELTLIKLCQLMDPTPNAFGNAPAQPLRNPAAPAQPAGGYASGGTAHPKGEAPAGIRQPSQPQQSVPQQAASLPPQQSEAASQSDKRTEVRQMPVQNPPAGSPAVRRIKSVRLSDPVAEVTDRTQIRREKFSDEQFVTAWQHLVATKPYMPFIISGVRQPVPQRRPGAEGVVEYELVVTNQAQMQNMETHLKDAVDMLRDELRNDTIELKVSLDAEMMPKFKLSSKEFLQDIVDKNAVLNEFLQDIEGVLEM